MDIRRIWCRLPYALRCSAEMLHDFCERSATVLRLPTVGVVEYSRRQRASARAPARRKVRNTFAPAMIAKLLFLISDFLLGLRGIGHLVAERESSHWGLAPTTQCKRR